MDAVLSNAAIEGRVDDRGVKLCNSSTKPPAVQQSVIKLSLDRSKITEVDSN
jgi:hypothetical protein